MTPFPSNIRITNHDELRAKAHDAHRSRRDLRHSLCSDRFAVHGFAHESPTRITNHDLPRGFTLLEVMVALAILATAFAAALRLHSDCMGMLLSSRIHTKAAELAQYKMTELEVTGLIDHGLLSGDFGNMAPDYVWDIQEEPTSIDFVIRVTVTVRNRHGGRAGAFELSEYMTDRKAMAALVEGGKK